MSSMAVDETAPRRGAVPLDLDRASSAADPIQAYLQEVGRRPLLSARDEVQLALSVEVGILATEMLHQRADLDAATRDDLVSLMTQGAHAKRRMIEANLRLVVSIAKRYAGRGLPLLDLVQEGNIGLIRAVEKFDYARGYKFSTYATWWIRQAISRALADQSRTIRVPIHVAEVMRRVRDAQRQLHQEGRRLPSTEEVATAAGVQPERVVEMRRIALDTVSLHTPVGRAEGNELGDVIQDKASPPPEDAAAASLLRADLDVILTALDQRTAEVLRLRYGLGDGRVRTLEEVSRAVGVTREQVRQIEANGLSTLRRARGCVQLRDYLN